MYHVRHIGCCFLLATLALVACRPPASLPTPVPTAALPTAAPPTDVPASAPATLPVTRSLETPTNEPTAVLPTRQAPDTPTPVIGPVISLTRPQEGERLLLGSDVTVAGFGQVAPGMNVQVGLTSATGLALASAEAAVEGTDWQATLSVPQHVSGIAQVHAVIVDAGGGEQARRTVQVELAPDTENSSAYLRLFHPGGDATAVAGHNLFVDGQLWRSGGGLVQVAVLMNDCRENVADLSFQLATSSYWYGFLVLPRDVAGPACLVARVGQEGVAGWYEAQIPLTVLHQDDVDAQGLTIANPVAGRRVVSGESLLINGVAYNVPGRAVTVEVTLPNGQVIAEAEGQADYYGYWRAEVTIPPGLEDEALVRASLGDQEEPDAVAEVLFNIIPAAQ